MEVEMRRRKTSFNERRKKEDAKYAMRRREYWNT